MAQPPRHARDRDFAAWALGQARAIREGLFESTRARLMSRFGISDSEADSVLRLIDSQLDVSIEKLLR